MKAFTFSFCINFWLFPETCILSKLHKQFSLCLQLSTLHTRQSQLPEDELQFVKFPYKREFKYEPQQVPSSDFAEIPPIFTLSA